MEQGCCVRRTHNLIPPVLAALTLALWFWNHTCTTRTLRPVSAASVSRTWRNHGDRRFPASHEENKALRSTLKYLNISSTFSSRPTASLIRFDSSEGWIKAVVFLDLLVIASSKPWPGRSACFRARLRRQFYLSMTLGAGGLCYSSLPQLTQNRMLLATSKLGSEVGGDFFNLRILFVKLL